MTTDIPIELSAKIVEAALFSAGRAVALNELSRLTGLGEDEVEALLHELGARYKRRDTALEITKAGAKYAMQVRAKYAQYVAALAQQEIPEKLLETLALIAYHQPIKQVDLLRMLGSRVYEHVKALTELGLVRAKAAGRTKVLTTTARFPEYFGIEGTSKKRIKQWLVERLRLEHEHK